jgi:putative colanic acid biosynthesis acetyltransferase WcaF
MKLDQYDNSGFERGAAPLRELLWWLVRSLCFAPWFPLPSGLKVGLLRVFGAKVGRGVVIRSRVNITFPWKLEIGDHVWIGDEVMILSLDRVKIGSHVCISQRAFLCTGSHRFRSENFDLTTKPISIGDGCWVAANVFIGPGVTLSGNTCCSAGAVVLSSAGPDVVLSGNPATSRPLAQGGAVSTLP